MATTDTDTWMIEVDGELIPDYDRTLTNFNEGDVVTGTVVRVDKDEILVDIGYKSEGVIPISELSIRRSVNPDEEVEIGQEIDALVLQKEDAEGRLILSKKRARFEKAWQRIEAAAESGEPVEGKVIEVVKGGLIIDLGVRGFLPASLVDIRRVQDLEEYRDQTLLCKVIELNRSRNNVVLSRRAVLEEERKEARQQILDRLSLDVDRERQRISLGLKQTQTDPWQRVIDETQQGDVVAGRITKVVTFGAFAEIVSGVEGLIHISELAEHHVENPREVVQQGEDVKVKIIEIDPDRRRLSLSLRRVEPDDPVKTIDLGTPGGRQEAEVPELGLSEEVFADQPQAAEAEAARCPGDRGADGRHRERQVRGAARVRAPRREDALERRRRAYALHPGAGEAG